MLMGKTIFYRLPVLLWCVTSTVLMAQSIFPAPFAPPLHYTVCRTIDPIVIDGNLDEKSWQEAPWTADFIDIEGDAKPKPYYQTRAKMLWDTEYLYIAAYLEDRHLWATLTERDAIIYRDNDFEVFIDPDDDTHNYLEVEVNAYNTVFDLMLVKPYRFQGPMVMDWNMPELKTAVSLQGTLNDPSDIDQGWILEMAIPIKSLVFHQKKGMPKDGSRWRINFSRVHWETAVVEEKYVKEKKPEFNWVWSPQHQINMHVPERWGYLQFSDQAVGAEVPPWGWTETDHVKWMLRELFNQQLKHKGKHGVFTEQLSDLDIDCVCLPDGSQLTYAIAADQFALDIRIQEPESKDWWHIDQFGRSWNERNLKR